MRPKASGGTRCGLCDDPDRQLPVPRDAHPGHTNAAVSSSRLVFLCVWTSPHVLLWGLCSLWVSLRCGQGLSAAGRVMPVEGRSRLVSRSLWVGFLFACPLSLAFFPLPHLPFKSLGFLAFCFSPSLSHCLSVLPIFTFAPLLPDLWSQDLPMFSPIRAAHLLVVLTLLQLRN